MIHCRRQNTRPSSVLMMVLILAFALKALIPAGFMPGAQGGFTKMVICSGTGERTVMVPNGDAPAPSHDQKDQSCAYHLAASQKFLTALPPSLPSIDIQPDEVFAFENESVVTLTPLHSLGARGPPASV